MEIVIESDRRAGCHRAAGIVARSVRRESSCVLGVPVGGTPKPMYRRLVDLSRDGDLDFRTVTTFNPDEFVGLSPDHPASNRGYMRRHLFDHVDLPASRRHLPDGTGEDLREEVRRYRRALELAGGIDLFVLGLGADGHLAFNDPGSSLASRLRVVPVTLAQRPYLGARFDGEADVPRYAITMGLADILDARRCVVLAFGGEKAAAVAAMVEGPVTAKVPASVLQHHPEAEVIVDEAAAADLELLEHYREAQRLRRELRPAGGGRVHPGRGARGRSPDPRVPDR